MQKEIQDLITETAKNRIEAGNYDKEIMLGNLGMLLAYMQIRQEQYEYLIKLVNPVEISNNPDNVEITHIVNSVTDI